MSTEQVNLEETESWDGAEAAQVRPGSCASSRAPSRPLSGRSQQRGGAKGRLEAGGVLYSYFTTPDLLRTPQDITLAGLAMELTCPARKAAEAQLCND
jgi:hypothetical protein